MLGAPAPPLPCWGAAETRHPENVNQMPAKVQLLFFYCGTSVRENGGGGKRWVETLSRPHLQGFGSNCTHRVFSRTGGYGCLRRMEGQADRWDWTEDGEGEAGCLDL